MIKKQRKIDGIKARPQGPVLRAAGKKRTVAMSDVAVNKSASKTSPILTERKFVYRAPNFSTSKIGKRVLGELEIDSQQNKKENWYRASSYKSKLISSPKLFRAPLISSFITRQKNIYLPQTLNFFKLTVLAMLLMLVGIPAISAFEAHIINVTAVLKQIDPPVLTPPGSNTAWDNTNGGVGLSGTTNIAMSDSDADAINIYFTYLEGSVNANAVPDPVCGQTGPNGGGGAKTLPQQLSITTSSVVKAISCDSTNSFQSVINTKIYSYGQQVNGLVINEFLPNASTTLAGNQGVASGHTTGKGGEWVELYNAGASPINLSGYILYDSFIPPQVSTSTVWTTHNDFVNPPNSNIISASTTDLSVSGTGNGDGSVMLDNGVPKNGGILMNFDSGVGNQTLWQNISWTSATTSSTFVCLQAYTSNDDVTYTPFGSCSVSSPVNLSGAPHTRYLRWGVTLSRGANPGNAAASLSDVTLTYTIPNNYYHELAITPANTNTGGTSIAPGGFLVAYRDGDADFELDTPTNQVSLYDGHIFDGANLIDSHAYNFGGPIPLNKSFARVPDGSTNWIDPCPTPGAPNVSTECDALPVAPAAVIDDSASTTPEANSTPDSTSTLENLDNQGGNSDSVSQDNSGSQASSSPASGTSTSTPAYEGSAGVDSTAPTSTPPEINDNQNNSTSTPVVTPDSGSGTTTEGSTDSNATPPPVDPPSPPKKDEAVLPDQQNPPPAVQPAPITGGGDTPPPPDTPTPSGSATSSASN